MAPSTITLRVPADAPFRTLAAAAVCRFGELCGATAASTAALEAAVARAADELAPGTDHLDIVCRHDANGIEVSVSAAGGRRVVTHAHS